MTIFLTTLLILLCLVIVLLILIQRTSGGMGSALGGGAADQVLGAGSAAQLTKLTVWGILGFFILAVLLYVTYQGQAGEVETLQRTGVEMTPDPASGPPSPTELEVPPPPPADSVPAAPAPVPVIPGEKAPAEGNKSE
ncbi:MAG: preprotein translocase subunit SecG [Verrucomicrobia bacterium TMED175]|nr:MAG: preprotein translocase subunit SecG [Verrucomicrobia bacterium TMED175]